MHQKFTYVAGFEIAARVIALASVGIVVILDLGFYAVLWSMGIVGVFSALLSFFLSRSFWSIRGRPRLELARHLLAVAAPLGLLAVSSLIHHRGGILMLSLLQPAEDVGIYTVAFRIYDMTTLTPWMFMATVFPLLAAYLHRRDPLGRAAIERAFNFMMLVFVPAAAMLFVYADRLVVFVSNQDFAAAATPLRILAFAVPFSAAGSVFALALIALNQQKKLLLLSVAAVIINVSINAYLVPRYSYRAAAATTVFSECLGCVATFAIARRTYRFRLESLNS